VFAKFPVTLVAARELPWAGVTTARDLGARSFPTPDRTYGPDFDPAVVEETADAGMYMYARP